MPVSKTMVFENDGTPFSALRKAEAWLKEKGYSVGTMQFPNPIGIKKGDYTISKWWNMMKAEHEQLDGIITGEFRSGNVTIKFYRREEG